MTRNELITELKRNFDIRELVCSHCYKEYGEKAWQFLSTEILSVLYTLRYEVFKCPMIINTWAMKGTLSQRGFRCNRCSLVKDKKNVYLSAHQLGKAFDFNVDGYTTEDVYNKIKENIDKFEYPIRIEVNTTTWNHIDVYQPVDSEANLIEFKG